jgi:hypothetical protein
VEPVENKQLLNCAKCGPILIGQRPTLPQFYMWMVGLPQPFCRNNANLSPSGCN